MEKKNIKKFAIEKIIIVDLGVLLQYILNNIQLSCLSSVL